MLLQILVNGTMVGALYGLIAIGFILIFKSAGIFNLAQGEMVMVGGYFCWWGMTSLGFPTVFAVVFAMLLSIILGALIERFTLRPLIGEPLLAVVMMTIAISLILRGTSMIVWTPQVQFFPSIFPEKYIVWGDIPIAPHLLIGFALSLLALLGFTLFFKFTKIGLRMRCVSDNQTGARSIGINISRIMVITWMISGFTATLGGIVLASGVGTISVDLADLGMKALVVALLAGLESLHGALIGGIILGVGEGIAAMYIDPLVGGGIVDVFPFLIMMVVLMIRPYGLFGLKEIERV